MLSRRIALLSGCALLVMSLPGCGAVVMMASQAGQVAMALDSAKKNKPYGVVLSTLATVDGTVRPVERVVVVPNTTSDQTADALAAYLKTDPRLNVVGPDAAVTELVRQRFFELPGYDPSDEERVEILRTVASAHDADAAIWMEPNGSAWASSQVQEFNAVMRIVSARNDRFLLEQGFVVQVNMRSPVVDISSIRRGVAETIGTRVLEVVDAGARKRLDLVSPSRPPDDGLRDL